MAPKVTVCVPTYNQEEYVGETLRSVLSQDFDDFEIIVIDDCSNDQTYSEILRFSDSRMSVLRNPRNLGMVSNWNKCIQLAKGEYVVLLHGDDILSPGMLETESRNLDMNPRAAFVFSACRLIGPKGEILSMHIPWNTDRVITGSEFIEYLDRNLVVAPTVMVRRQCYLSVGGYNTALSLCADWEMWLRIALAGYQIAYVRKPLASYRIHRRSMTARLRVSGLSILEQKAMYEGLFNSKEIYARFSQDELFHMKREASVRIAASELELVAYCLLGGSLKAAGVYLKEWLFELLILRFNLEVSLSTTIWRSVTRLLLHGLIKMIRKLSKGKMFINSGDEYHRF